MKRYLAIDIGASGGKAFINEIEGNRLVLKEINRFPNVIKMVNNHKTWDLDALFENIVNSLKIAHTKYGNIDSIGIDTFGVDYVLFDENNNEIKPYYSYRDDRYLSIIEEVNSIISKEKLFEITGSQFQPFNTLYQLYLDKKEGRIKDNYSFLMLPEYFYYRLTGIKVHELTNASTTNILDKISHEYSEVIVDKLGFNRNFFFNIPIKKPGYIYGDLLPEIAKKVGGNTKVKLVCTHDTASAIRALPKEENTLYLSTGSWFLLGVKQDKPITTIEALKSNFSNELGPDYVRFQKNIIGLSLIENIKNKYNYEYSFLIEEAKKSDFKEIFDVNEQRFLNTSDVEEEIKTYFKEKGLVINELKDVLNSIFISLTTKVKETIDEIEQMLDKKYQKLFVLGGGNKNAYLMELIKNITKKELAIIKEEATSLGNIVSLMED